MKLEAVIPMEDSKMDSKKTSSDQPAESAENGINGNGVENGNGAAADREVSQNGKFDVKPLLESGEELTECLDSKEKACPNRGPVSNPDRATRSASKPGSGSDREVLVSPGVATPDCKDIPDCKVVPSYSSEATSELADAESEDSKNIPSEKELISESKDAGVESKNSLSDNEATSESRDTRVDSKDIPSDNAGTFEIKDAALDSKISKSEPMDTEESEKNETDNDKKNMTAVASTEGKHISDGSALDLEKDTSADSSNKSGGEEPITDTDSTDCRLDKKVKETDPDLEKVKSGGLTLKLDSGEEFSVQLADEEEEEEAKSHCKTLVANDSDDDVTVVRVETKPKPKAEIRVTYGGPAGAAAGVARTLPVMAPNLAPTSCTFLTSSAPVVTGATSLIPSGGNIFVPVQFPPTSVLKSGQLSVPVLLNTQTGSFVKNVGQNLTVKSVASNQKPTVQVTTATVDPVAAANYAKAKELHAKKVEDFKELSSFLNSMRNKVTVQNTVDALRGHVVKIPEYRRLEAAKRKALAWKMEADVASVVSEKESDDADREKSVTPVSKDDESKDGRESETTEVGEKDDDEATDVEMKDKTDDDEATDVEMNDETKDEAGDKPETAKSAELGKDAKDKEEKGGDKSDDVTVKSVEDEKVVGTETEEGKGEKSEEGSESDEKKDDAKTSDSDKTEVTTGEAKDTAGTKEEEKTVADEKPAAKTVVEPAVPEQASEKGDHEEAAKKLRPVARFLYYSGLDLAREYIYKDLLDKQEVLIEKKKLSFEEQEDFHRLRRIYSSYRRKNKPMHPKVKKCRSCNFQTESKNAMHNHQEYGHVDLSVGRYECALCDFDSRAASAFKFHMEAEHSMVGRVTVKPCFWHCDLCPYEHNNKAMVIKHKMKCGKKFDIKKHLFPTYDDINFLFRALPGPSIGANPVLTPPAPPKPGGSAWATVGPKTVYNKPYTSLPTSSYASIATAKPQVPQIVTYMTSNGPVRVQLNQSQPRPQLPTMATSKPALVKHLTSPAGVTPAPTLLATQAQGIKRPAAPIVAPAPAKVARSELEICEICGGFIKDRHSLRLHFKMAHCIEIDESVITSKHTAPLSCDVCMKRFWTFQGLTMHRVAMNHIPSTNTKSMRGSKCFICSVFVADIMKHINSTHNMIPGQLNTIRICPVCGHNMTPGNLVSHLKLLHNMILPLPGSLANQPTSVATSSDQNKVYTCTSCKRSFISIKTLNKHIDQTHSYKCHLCDFRCTAIDVYKNHITQGHKKAAKKCQICKKSFIGAAYTVHVQKEHCRKFSIKLDRCDHLVTLFKGSSKTNEKAYKALGKETPAKGEQTVKTK
ncbi:uncharacterized protein LOC135495631 [Lineus longissimus]|uniref:uncharacterized protein LOC135495631 n=1 Tax=Lineus longissimus TaxID=88925 RepID=UPI00315D877B